MGKRQLHNFKRLLAERILSLQKSINCTILGLKKGREAYPDPYDLAASDRDTGVEIAIRKQDRVLLLSLCEALDRIEKGCYGFCRHCGEAIATKRLKANPAATVCIDCKEREEVPGQRRPGRPVPGDRAEALRPSSGRAGR